MTGIEACVFAIVSLMAIVGALGVVFCRNPYHSALWMVFSFVGIAGLFALLQAYFLTALQIIVYAGAIVVMIAFVMMTIDFRKVRGLSKFVPQWLWGLIISFGILIDLFILTSKMKIDVSQAGKNLAIAGSNTKALGMELFTSYLFPFEMVAVILLVALIGVVVLTKRGIK
ncbi:MAG: NADH-quinone oxidoreductase subunit J [Deltaproteobacteria bacterium]|nr:NADH-quinone oxidoreductase subunit J [Deltaproteobacteria bacterium]